MFHRLLGFATVMTFLVAGIGCNGGYSDTKAEQRCQQELESKDACVTDAALQECVSCYKACGHKCTAQATCPETYDCVE